MALAARIAKQNLEREKKDDMRRQIANEKAEKLRIVEEARMKVRSCVPVPVRPTCILCPSH